MPTRIIIAGLPKTQAHLQNLASALRDLRGIRASVGSNVSYAEIIHKGSRPHVILPRNKQALFWKGARHPVRRVQHPGTKPNQFMITVFRGMHAEIVESVGRGLGLAIEFPDLHGAAGLGQVMDKLEQALKDAAPVRTGKFRNSLRQRFRQRGGAPRD